MASALHQIGEGPLTLDSLFPILLRSIMGWDQVATFVAQVIRRKMEVVRERQRWPAAANQRLMPELTILLTFVASFFLSEKEDDSGLYNSSSP